jgi:CP family cyanate transporter-like MFS transporter
VVGRFARFGYTFSMTARPELPGLGDELLTNPEDASPAPVGSAPVPAPARGGFWLLLALVLVAINLRPALSSLAPVLKTVQAGTGISGTAAGLLTTLPVLCLGLFGPLAPRFARRFGSEKVVLWILLLMAAGIVLRSLGGSAGLFAGTVVAGACIGIINVLLPGIVKRDFADKADIMTGVYTMALCIGAALAAGLTVPMQHATGSWRIALAAWALPAVIAAAAWWPWQRGRHVAVAAPSHARSLLHDRLAWQVTLYMGLQSSLAYCVFGWLPAILQDRGLSALESGFSLSVSVMVQIVSSLGAPWLANRHVRHGGDQRLTIALVLACTLSGLLGCLFAPLSTLWLWIVVLGIGQGGTFSMALSLIVLRSRDPATAARLSGMVQGVGYSVAALGPFLVGLLHERSGSWQALGLLFTLIATGALIAGMAAGRQRFVLEAQPPAQN